MKYFYDRKADSLYLTFAERPYGDSVEAAPGVVLDFDKEGRVVGIDFERASKFVDVNNLQLHEEPGGRDAEAARLDGASLKREREALGLSQAELGRKLSVTSNTIARWERGELKIEHPSMLQLAIAALRSSRTPRVERFVIPKTAKASSGKFSRASTSGRFTATKAQATQRSGDVRRAKKK